MKEEYWFELGDIFFNNEELQKEHESLFKVISLIIDVNKKHQEIDNINKELQELNK